MIQLTAKQIETKEKIRRLAIMIGVDPIWATAVALLESSLGLHQKSPTNCRGVFQMSSIAMKDLLLEMEKSDDDLIDIACGLLFLRLLKGRWKTLKEATNHFCDPNDRDFYWDRVQQYMKELKEDEDGTES